MKSLKEQIAVMQAADSGKEIQFMTKGGCLWVDCENPQFDWFSQDYRVKPATPDRIDWSAVKPEFRYMARDEDGKIFVFTIKPTIGKEQWNNFDKNGNIGIAIQVDRILSSCTPGDADWTESLVSREGEEA